MPALIKAKSVARSGDGVDVSLRAVLDGQLSVADYFFVQALKGRMFTASSPSVTTVATWTATAAIDITKPAFWISVPSGRAIIPVNLCLYYEAFGTTAQAEMQGVIGTGGSYTSGGTAATITCTRTDLSNQSSCTIYAGNSLAVVGSTANLNYFWRNGQQFAITKSAGSATAAASDPNRFCWSAIADCSFNIAGPGSQLAINQGSQAGTGFCYVQFVEIPSSELP